MLRGPGVSYLVYRVARREVDTYETESGQAVQYDKSAVKIHVISLAAATRLCADMCRGARRSTRPREIAAQWIYSVRLSSTMGMPW